MTYNERDTLRYLSIVHFSDSNSASEGQDLYHSVTMAEWQTASSPVTRGRTRWALKSFKPFKSAELVEIFPVTLQKENSQVIPWLVGMNRDSIALRHVLRF